MKRGFTLIELSVVLVIIGLIVGGILVGRDLISTAEIRKDIATFDAYCTAANTFRLKYNALPGDMVNASAYLTLAGSCNNVLGDGIIHSNGGGIWTCGGVAFFDMLNAAGLTSFRPSGYGTTDVAPGKAFPGLAMANEVGWMPFTATGSGTSGSGFPLTIVSGRGNWFRLGLSDNHTGGGNWTFNGITTAQAYAIDSKIDDGFPLTGNVLALCQNAWDSGLDYIGSPSYDCVFSGLPARCISSSAGNPYNFATTVKACGLGIKESF